MKYLSIILLLLSTNLYASLETLCQPKRINVKEIAHFDEVTKHLTNTVCRGALSESYIATLLRSAKYQPDILVLTTENKERIDSFAIVDSGAMGTESEIKFELLVLCAEKNKQGKGSKLLRHIENLTKLEKNNQKKLSGTIFLNSVDTAKSFYRRNGYFNVKENLFEKTF